MKRESIVLEYKESITRTFLKTVSAFANYGTGRIVFGIDDEGNAVGLHRPVEDALRIENMVCDSIEPIPRYAIDINEPAKVVTLTVFEGENKPYLYNGHAYQRQDASTRETDRLELRRLVLAGQNKTFDAMDTRRQDLSFSLLAEGLRTAAGVSAFDDDVKRTLGLLTIHGAFTNAAALLADDNDFPGIDIAVMGNSINEFRDRITIAGKSLLTQYQAAMDAYERYCVTEVVEGSKRNRVEKIPLEAFRETVANALVHRAWDVPANTTVSICTDKIEVVSPGGLPSGMSEDDYMRGGVSLPRNPLIATVFFRLNLIEKFGTGIRRIRSAYQTSGLSPRFEVRSNSISVTLPNVEAAPSLTNDEQNVLSSLGKNILLPREQIEEGTGFSKDKTIRLLNNLEEKRLVVREGRGRGTRYRRA